MVYVLSFRYWYIYGWDFIRKFRQPKTNRFGRMSIGRAEIWMLDSASIIGSLQYRKHVSHHSQWERRISPAPDKIPYDRTHMHQTQPSINGYWKEEKKIFRYVHFASETELSFRLCWIIHDNRILINTSDRGLFSLGFQSYGFISRTTAPLMIATEGGRRRALCRAGTYRWSIKSIISP